MQSEEKRQLTYISVLYNYFFVFIICFNNVLVEIYQSFKIKYNKYSFQFIYVTIITQIFVFALNILKIKFIILIDGIK